VPAIRDTVAGGQTILLDTLERWKEKSNESFAAAMELFDAGFRNGAVVTKMVPDGKNNWRRESIPVFAPYACAAIDRDSLADTALDRSFVIEMVRKPVAVKKARYSYHHCEEICAALRDDLYLWALQAAEAVWETYRSSALDRDVDRLHLHDRAVDIWRPLFAIAHVIYGSDNLPEDLCRLSVELGGETETAEAAQKLVIVRVLRQHLGGRPIVAALTTELVEVLSRADLAINQFELHSLLTAWGFTQKECRLPQGPRRAWILAEVTLERLEGDFSPPQSPPN
jgi:hypothetical protein